MNERYGATGILGQIILERALHIKGEPNNAIQIKIGLPRPAQFQRAVFQCPFSVTGHGIDFQMFAEGIDSIQALRLALEMIGMELWIYNRDNPKKSRFLADDEADLWFPLPGQRKWEN